MEDLRSKYRLFRFKDKSILDVSKIDYITENPQATKYLIHINGHVLETDKGDEAERLIKTWDAYIGNEEANSELMYKQLKINGMYLDAISHKLDFILAMYSRVHNDVMPEYPLGDLHKKEDESVVSK